MRVSSFNSLALSIYPLPILSNNHVFNLLSRIGVTRLSFHYADAIVRVTRVLKLYAAPPSPTRLFLNPIRRYESWSAKRNDASEFIPIVGASNINALPIWA